MRPRRQRWSKRADAAEPGVGLAHPRSHVLLGDRGRRVLRLQLDGARRESRTPPRAVVPGLDTTAADHHRADPADTGPRTAAALPESVAPVAGRGRTSRPTDVQSNVSAGLGLVGTVPLR